MGPVLGKSWGWSCTWQGFCWGQRHCHRRAGLADSCPSADPSFIHAELIPDSAERNDDKLYFFFRERSAETSQSPAVYARIGRICLVGAAGGQPGSWLCQPFPSMGLGLSELI